MTKVDSVDCHSTPDINTCGNDDSAREACSCQKAPSLSGNASPACEAMLASDTQACSPPLRTTDLYPPGMPPAEPELEAVSSICTRCTCGLCQGRLSGAVLRSLSSSLCSSVGSLRPMLYLPSVRQ